MLIRASEVPINAKYPENHLLKLFKRDLAVSIQIHLAKYHLPFHIIDVARPSHILGWFFMRQVLALASLV